MTTLPLDPLAATVHLRIEELRREAAAERAARSTRRRRTAPRSFPGALVTALRESIARSAPAPARTGELCTTC